MAEHGTRTRYNAGCRCVPCRDVNWQDALKRYERARADPGLIPHGTSGGYRNWGCRCPQCTAANTAAWARWWAKQR